MSRAFLSGIALALAITAAGFDFVFAAQFCPTVLCGKGIDPDGKTRFFYGGKKCPDNLNGTGSDTRSHTLGTSCGNCPDPIVIPEVVMTTEAPTSKKKVRSLAVPGVNSGFPYAAPRANDPGSAPQGRQAPIIAQPGVKIVKDFELTVRRGARTHHFRIIGMRPIEPIGDIFYFGFELAVDDPDRDRTREPVKARLKDLGSVGAAHTVVFQNIEFDVFTSEIWE